MRGYGARQGKGTAASSQEGPSVCSLPLLIVRFDDILGLKACADRENEGIVARRKENQSNGMSAGTQTGICRVTFRWGALPPAG